MSEPKKIRVRMRPDRVMPLPSGIGIDTNVRVLTPETEVEVLMDNPWVRRRLAAGDLVECGAAPAPLPPAPIPEPPLFDDSDSETPPGKRSMFNKPKAKE